MDQRLTSKAAQSAAASSSLEELIKQLKEENAALKRELEEKDKKLQAAIKEKRNLQNRLRDWKNRSKKIEAVKPTVQSKTEQVKPAVASTKKEAVIKPTKAEPIVESTKGTTYENIESVKSPNKKPLPELRWQNANDYKNDVLVPNLIDNIEEHYGDKWPDDWTLTLIGQLEAKSANNLAYTIKTLGLAGAYYPSSDSPESDDHSIQWPEKPEDLYVELTGTNPPTDNNNDNKEQLNDLYIS